MQSNVLKFSNYNFFIDHDVLDIVFKYDGEIYKNKMITIIKPFQAFVETKPFFSLFAGCKQRSTLPP